MGGGENLATIDSYYLPPRRRPGRTGASYHNKVLTVAIQDGEGLVWRLPPPVSQVERRHLRWSTSHLASEPLYLLMRFRKWRHMMSPSSLFRPPTPQKVSCWVSCSSLFSVHSAP